MLVNRSTKCIEVLNVQSVGEPDMARAGVEFVIKAHATVLRCRYRLLRSKPYIDSVAIRSSTSSDLKDSGSLSPCAGPLLYFSAAAPVR